MKTLLLAIALLGGCFVLPKKTTTARRVGIERGELSDGDGAAAASPIALELAPGAHADATTDERGNLVYAIPPSEPYDGTVTVRGAETEQRVEVHRPMPALAVARDAMLDCG